MNKIVELAAFNFQGRRIIERLSNLSGTCRDVVALAKDPLRTAVGTERYIDTNDNRPFKNAPYNVAPKKMSAAQIEIKKRQTKESSSLVKVRIVVRL